MKETRSDAGSEGEFADGGVGDASDRPALVDLRRAGAEDANIRLAVMEAIHWDLAIPPHRVKVAIDNGWVVLSGRVRHPYSKRRAEWDARNAPGVVGVTNAITLEG